MNLPTPTSEEIAEFKEIYRQEFGVELTDGDAREAATRILRLFCLATYGSPHVRNELPKPNAGQET